MSDDDDLLPFDGICPHCHGPADVGEIFDGEDRRCGNCGRGVVGVGFGTFFALVKVDPRPLDLRSGRERTRARWRRQGRRS